MNRQTFSLYFRSLGLISAAIVVLGGCSSSGGLPRDPDTGENNTSDAEEALSSNLIKNGRFSEGTAGWICATPENANGGPCPHEGGALVVGAFTSAWSTVDVSRGDALDLEASTVGDSMAPTVYLAGRGTDELPASFAQAVRDKGLWKASTISSGTQLNVVVWNQGNAPLRLDNVSLKRSGKNKRALTLLKAEGRLRLVVDRTSASDLWVPLPMDYAAHVPLKIDLKVEPSTLLRSVEYKEDELHNFGAVVHLNRNPTANMAALSWTGVSLTIEADAQERRVLYAGSSGGNEWLSPSPIIQSADPFVLQIAKGLSTPNTTAAEQVRAAIAWTSTNIQGEGDIVGLDAKTVMESKRASCTGFTNAAAALGRARGVASRHLANIAVMGQTSPNIQQMHSINEFWFSESKEWRRVEPQSSALVQAEASYIPMRIVRAADEAPPPGYQAIPGVPYREFPSFLTNNESVALAGMKCTIAEVSESFQCHHSGVELRKLVGSVVETKALFDAARARWRSHLQKRVAGVSDPRMSVATPETIRTAADLRAHLSRLEQ